MASKISGSYATDTNSFPSKEINLQNFAFERGATLQTSTNLPSNLLLHLILPLKTNYSSKTSINIPL